VWAESEAFKRLRPYLACQVKQRPEGGPCERFQIDDWESIAKRHEDTNPIRKADLALSLVVRESKKQDDGADFLLTEDHGLYFDAINVGQVEQVLDYLIQEGLVHRIVGNKSVAFASIRKAYVKPTLLGEQRYWLGGDPIKSTTCFVAMSFNKALDPIFYDFIRPAAKECDYDAFRVDQKEHNGKITDEIIAGIRSARFVIADFTEQKGGVYYEAGFAAGLDRPVIYTCRRDDIDNCHFDTRDYNHITWETPEELQTKLVNRIKATIGLPVRD
jgi:hypothetical protein